MIMLNEKYKEDDVPREERSRILDELAREKGYSNYEHLRDCKAREMGFSNWYGCRRYLAMEKRNQGKRIILERISFLFEMQKEMAIEARRDYKQMLAQGSRRRKELKRKGKLISKILSRIGKSKTWLAGRLGETRSRVSDYLCGKISPPNQIYEFLGIDLSS